VLVGVTGVDVGVTGVLVGVTGVGEGKTHSILQELEYKTPVPG
jgi:hypothetical protein